MIIFYFEMNFTKQKVVKLDGYYMYKEYILSIQAKPSTRILAPSPTRYYYAEDIYYLYDVLKHDSNSGPLFNDSLKGEYAKYLLEATCIDFESITPLLTHLFHLLGIDPYSMYWNKFEDIISNIPEVYKLWSDYDYLKKTYYRKTNIPDAGYFINHVPRKNVTKLTLEDIMNLPREIYIRPLPAIRPIEFEYSVKKLGNTCIYRNTYICNQIALRPHKLPSKSNPIGTEHIINIIEDKTTYETKFVLTDLILRDYVYDTDFNKEHTYMLEFRENVLKEILLYLNITPISNEFRKIEDYVKNTDDPFLKKAWLNWNYYETDFVGEDDDRKGYLANAKDYFKHLFLAN